MTTVTPPSCISVGLTKDDLHSGCDRVGGAEGGVGESVGVSTWYHTQWEGRLDWDKPCPLEVDTCSELSVEQEAIEQLIEETISSHTNNTGRGEGRGEEEGRGEGERGRGEGKGEGEGRGEGERGRERGRGEGKGRGKVSGK